MSTTRLAAEPGRSGWRFDDLLPERAAWHTKAARGGGPFQRCSSPTTGTGRRSSNRSPVPPVPWRGRMRGGRRRRGRRHWDGMSARERTAGPASSGNRSAVKVPWPLSSDGQARSAMVGRAGLWHLPTHQ